MRMGGALVVAVMLAAALVGCATPGPGVASEQAAAGEQVKQTVRRYLEAIYAGRAGAAWELHSRDTLHGESFDEFDQVVRAVASATEGQVEIERVEEPKVEGDRATVKVVQRLGERSSTYEFTLVRENGQWRIHSPRTFDTPRRG